MKLPTGSTTEYVEATIKPTLTPALTALCKAKPSDPVTWLAEYLIAHKPAPPTTPPPLVPTTAQPTAAALLHAIHSGQKSCVDVIAERLSRIEAVNGTLLACNEVLDKAALEMAAAVDKKVKAGQPLRRLEGLPILVKTNIDLAGTLSTAATPALKDWRPTTTAPCVAALLAEGAIPIAKTPMCELAVGFTGKSVLHGHPINPHNPEYNAGGSSTGTGVGIAAGIAPCGLGSDTAGSLRVPSICNGGVGMRPSKGRWSGQGVVPCSTLRDTPGPMGATVGDVALLDAVVNGEPIVEAAGLATCKVVVAEDWISESRPVPLAPETRAALACAVSALEAAGAQVAVEDGFAEVTSLAKATWEPPMPVPLEDLHADLKAYLDFHGEALPEGARTVEGLTAQCGNPMLAGFFKEPTDPTGKNISEADVAAKFAARDAAIAATEEAYQAFFRRSGASAVLVPCFPAAPTKMDDPKMALSAIFNEGAFCANLCTTKGTPAIVLPTPIKYEVCGLPVGVMLYAKDDRTLLSVALALEQALKA